MAARRPNQQAGIQPDNSQEVNECQKCLERAEVTWNTVCYILLLSSENYVYLVLVCFLYLHNNLWSEFMDQDKKYLFSKDTTFISKPHLAGKTSSRTNMTFTFMDSRCEMY